MLSFWRLFKGDRVTKLKRCGQLHRFFIKRYLIFFENFSNNICIRDDRVDILYLFLLLSIIIIIIILQKVVFQLG